MRSPGNLDGRDFRRRRRGERRRHRDRGDRAGQQAAVAIDRRLGGAGMLPPDVSYSLRRPSEEEMEKISPRVVEPMLAVAERLGGFREVVCGLTPPAPAPKRGDVSGATWKDCNLNLNVRGKPRNSHERIHPEHGRTRSSSAGRPNDSASSPGSRHPYSSSLL